MSARQDHRIEPVAVDPENPWLGLSSYAEETRAYFHGRDEEAAELARRVQRKNLTVLFGQSGLGRHLEDRLLDLIGRRGRFRRVVDADVDRAESRPAQARHQARAQQRSLAEARLAEQHGQQLPLHAPREFRRLFVATVEVRPRFF